MRKAVLKSIFLITFLNILIIILKETCSSNWKWNINLKLKPRVMETEDCVSFS